MRWSEYERSDGDSAPARMPPAATPQGSTELAELFERHYGEIRSIARRALRKERPGHTLQATAIIHEAWLRLQQTDGLDMSDPVAQRGLVATVIRRVLVDHARSRSAQRAGGDWSRVPLDDLASRDAGLGTAHLLDLDGAIDALTELHPRRARVVELRLFGGLTQPEIARCLGVSLGTIELDWKIAAHWLRTRLAAE